MIFKGIVELIQEDRTITTPNHSTGSLMQTILSNMIGSWIQAYKATTYSYPSATLYMYGPAAGYYLAFGRGSYTPSFAVTALQTSVYTITPHVDFRSDYGVTGEMNLYFTVVLTSQQLKNMGGLLSEIGLYMYGYGCPTTLDWTFRVKQTGTDSPTGYLGNAYALYGYISSPTDFIAADIDTDRALTVRWNIKMKFKED